MRLAIKRLARGATIAAAIVASSGSLEATGRPLFATLGDVAFNLTSACSKGAPKDNEGPSAELYTGSLCNRRRGRARAVFL